MFGCSTIVHAFDVTWYLKQLGFDNNNITLNNDKDIKESGAD